MKILPMTYDKMFYHIMHTNKDYLIMLIHLITNIPIKELKSLEYIDTSLNESNINNKHQRSDVVVKIEGYTINLEMNAKYYKEMVVKNNSYLYSLHNQDNVEGKSYNTTRIFIQINFDKFKRYGKKLLNEYIIKEKTNNMEYPIQRLKIYHIELDYLQSKEYTKSVNKKLIKYLNILLEEEVEKLKEDSKGDKILEGVVKEMIIFGKEIPYGYRDVELEDEMLKNTFRDKWKQAGRQEGLKEGRRETAINMLAMGMDKKTISQATNIPLKELEKLNYPPQI